MIVRECVYILEYNYENLMVFKHHSIVFSTLDEINNYLIEKKLLNNRYYNNFNIRITFFDVYEDF